MSELGLFSGIATPQKQQQQKKDDVSEFVAEISTTCSKDSGFSSHVSGFSSQVSGGLKNVRRQSFGSHKGSSARKLTTTSLLDEPLPENSSTTPDSKNTEQTVETFESPTGSLNSGDGFNDVKEDSGVTQENDQAAVNASASLSSDRVSSISRKLEYDEETGAVASQPMMLKQRSKSKMEEDPNVEVTLCNNNNNNNENETPRKEERPVARPPTKTPPPPNNGGKRSLLPFFIIGALCLFLGGITGALIVRNSDEYKAGAAAAKAAAASKATDGNNNNNGPATTSTTARPPPPTISPTDSPSTQPTTSAPTIFVPTTRPTRAPTSVPTRKPTQSPTSPNQVIGRSDRLDRIKYQLSGGSLKSCHPKADHWFLHVDTWGQEAWAPEVSAPNRDQLWMERYVVSCIYFSILSDTKITKQDGFGWLSSQHICEWENGSTDKVKMNCSESGEVTTFDVSQLASVNGTLPSEIGALTSLERLGFLRPKNLIGTIPKEISKLSLTFFRCIQCSLNGTIPSELGRLSMLTTLFLGDSFDKTRYLTGTIPSYIGRMTLLQALSIRNARLTGTIPSEIVNLWNLTELYLTGNRLSGEIPQLPENLTDCELAGLGYDGDFPEENCFPNLDDTVCTHWAQNCQ